MTNQTSSNIPTHHSSLSKHETMQDCILRIDSKDLFRQNREVEIAHEGRIYRLRLTQLNKLILTA